MQKRRWAALGALLLTISTPGTSRANSLEEALQRLQADDVLVADAAVEEIVAYGEPGADALLTLVNDPRRDVRAGAIRGLGLLKEERAVAPLSEALNASIRGRREPDTMEDRYFRILTIQALGRIGAPGAVRMFEVIVRSGDPFERAHAGISLFLSGEDPGYDLVRESLADTSMAIRNLTVEGLGESDDERAKALILSSTEDGSWVVRDTAYRALLRWRDEEGVQNALKRGGDDPSRFVRETVAEILVASPTSGS